MSIQEAALLAISCWRCAYAAERLASMTPTRISTFIRTWLLTPQEQLYGSSPREVIWQQLGEGNPIPSEYAAEAYGDWDCRSARAARRDRERRERRGAGHCWVYSPDAACSRYTPKAAKNAGAKN